MLTAAHNSLNVELRGCKSVSEIVERLKKHAATVPPGTWIEGMG